MLKIVLIVLFSIGYCLANNIWDLYNPKCLVIRNTTCPNENVTFWLYTNVSGYYGVKLDPLNLQKEIFQSKQPLYIILHGYKGHHDYRPNPSIRAALLEKENASVISVDYGPLVPSPCYFTAVENLPLASKCLAHFINTVVDQGVVENDDIHLIGFSLGAHVAGQTANHLKRRLKRITGLDPTKPLFTFVGKESRLDAGDAEFVDVIHTDSFIRGKMRPMGHVDFYPNFNLFAQPGCESAKEGRSRCNHHRAYEYYAESIYNNCKNFRAYRCPTWLPSIRYCRSKSNIMGHHVNQSLHGSFFLNTASSSPFALGPIY